MSSPESTEASISFMVPVPDGSRAWQAINATSDTGERDRNYDRKEHTVPVYNIRGKENTVGLDITGFQFLKRPAKHTAFDSDESIEQEYYPESIELIKELTGASKVVLFDHSEGSWYQVKNLDGLTRFQLSEDDDLT